MSGPSVSEKGKADHGLKRRGKVVFLGGGGGVRGDVGLELS